MTKYSRFQGMEYRHALLGQGGDVATNETKGPGPTQAAYDLERKIMNAVLSGSNLRKRKYPEPLWAITKLSGLLVIIAILLLTSCISSNTSPGQIKTGVPSHYWKLVWSDEFNSSTGTPPDPAKWSPNIGGDGWGNEQLDYDTNNQNAFQDGNGNLVLEASKDNPQGYMCWYGLCQYTSARISTQYHFSFTYGLIEANIKVSSGQGIWPAFWLMGDNYPYVGWPACGEIDVMENIGRTPNMTHASVHGPLYLRTSSYTLPHGELSDGFHVFAMQWDPNHLYFMIDGLNYYRVDKADFAGNWVFDHPFFIILNNAVGGRWPGNPNTTTVFPQKMLISYVRVYTEKENISSSA
jgi:beta-glucanase (GH16 family)